MPRRAANIRLRSPFQYRTHLLEALRRASIPAHFTRQAARPEPGGRALLVLLECAADGISATRFAEYLSLGVVPDRSAPNAAVASEPSLEFASDEASALLLREPNADREPPLVRPTKNLVIHYVTATDDEKRHFGVGKGFPIAQKGDQWYFAVCAKK